MTMVYDKVRRLRPGQTLPNGEPKRIKTTDGYIALRWKIGVHSYLEVLEHRVVAGVVTDDHVHHWNRQRDDNNPENLKILDAKTHGYLHSRRMFDIEKAIHLYELGYGTPMIGKMLGVDGSNIYRALRKAGIKSRGLGITTAQQKASVSRASKDMWADRTPEEREQISQRAWATRRRSNA